MDSNEGCNTISFDDFLKEWIDRNELSCECNATMSPCWFCDGSFMDIVKAEYERHLGGV